MKIKYPILFSLVFMLIASSCSQSGKRNSRHSGSSQTSSRDERAGRDEKNIVKMEKKNGVYQVPVEINGSQMSFIFDTGASDITISLTEAKFLFKQGTLTNDDILGTQQFQIADGSIAEGTIINLKTVKIGNKTLQDVQASIVHNNNAPLLFGQSALEKFGKISIDNNKGEIILED